MALILAINIDKKWQKILIGGGFLIFALIYLFNPNYYREDWKSVVSELKNKESVYMIGSFGDPVKFYNPEIKVYDLRDKIYESEIIVIPYGELIHGVDHEKILTDLGYKKTEVLNFREISLEKWNLIK